MTEQEIDLLVTKKGFDNELNTLTSKHGEGKITTLVTPLSQSKNCEYAVCFLLSASRRQMEMISDLMKQPGDALKAIEAVIINCWVGGDDKDLILKNDDALFGCDVPIYEFLQRKSGAIKKN